MDPVHLGDEHRLLRDQVRRFVEDEVLPHADRWEAEGMVPRATLRRMGELGFLGLRCPERFGGSAFDSVAAAVVAGGAARTAPAARPWLGMSMYLVERATPGGRVVRALEKMGWHCSDTAEILFED